MDSQVNGAPSDTKLSSPSTECPTTPSTFKRRRFGKRLWVIVGVTSVASFALFESWWLSCGFRQCPTVAQLQAWRPTEGGTLLDVHGAYLAPLSPVKRVNVPITRIPAHVQAAFVAVEDRRFYTHHGIDWHGLARAAFENAKALGVREGASTITMQLARNVFLSHRASERSVGRKLLEWRYARLIESALAKPIILERYLNAIYLGNGVYGVEGASQDLFGKSVHDVNLAEAALLAGLPKAPSNYTPRHDPDRARERRSVVLDVLQRENVATPAAIAAARTSRIAALPTEWQSPRRPDSWAVETVRGVLDSLRRIGAIPASLNDGQLRVRSTFDKRAQHAAERAVASGAWQIDRERGAGSLSPQHTEGSLVAIDPSTGAIRALVGGRRVERKGFNRAIRAKRQPGSAFKPFVYLTALQQGLTPATMIDDEPLTIGEGRNEWTPSNFNGEYAGRMTMRDALAHSANAATVRISQQVGIPRVVSQAHALGISSALPSVPALALGAGAVSPLELTTAYAPFNNGGNRVESYAVESVEDVFGRVLWSYPPRTTVQVVDVRDAFLLTSLLRSVIDDGTGRAVRVAGIRGPVAGKTGTTNDGTDVWFVGYTPTLVASVWFGVDDPQPLGGDASGGRLAAPVWARFVRDGWHSPELDSAWAPPAGIIEKNIDIGTGKLAEGWCGPSRREWFRDGTAPTESCVGESRIAMIDVPDVRDMVSDLIDVPEPPEAAEPRAPQGRTPRARVPQPARPPRPPAHNYNAMALREINAAVNAAINSIDNSRGKRVAKRMLDEIRRAADRDARRR